MGNRLTYGLCGLIALAISLGCFYMGFNKYSEHKRYPTEGISTQAYPTSDHYTETRRRFGIKSYDTDLAFKTPDGQVIHLAGANISKDELATLQTGETIAREYLPEDPEGTARKPNDSMGIWVFFAIALAALGFGVSYFKTAFGKATPNDSHNAGENTA